MPHRHAALSALILVACNGDGTSTTTDDTGTTATVPETYCSRLGLSERAFDPTEPAARHRREPAGDFSVNLRDGSKWTLSEHWTGCDTYVFLPHSWAISALDDANWWTTGVDELIARSPANVHYFFTIYSNSTSKTEEYGALAETEIALALGGLDEADQAWWLEHLHVVAEPLNDISGLVGDMSDSGAGGIGWGVDRFQQIRTLGYPPDVEAYDSALNSAGHWPYEMALYSMAAEAVYWNFEAERQERLDAVDATIVPIFGGAVESEYVDGPVTLPDAATMAGFDTLELDVLMTCPDPDDIELNNCGAWDYLAYLWLYDDADETWLEMGRFITTYHRESRWVVDASHALAWLQDGGERTVRYQWAPSWNVQPTGITVDLRLSNQGKGHAPVEIHPLFSGGGYSTTFNDDRPPVDVAIPADAVSVALVSIATGHGADTYSCAEFCDQTHTYAIGDESWADVQDAPGEEAGCRDSVDSGTVPNQAGTWWYGRAGWCPGRRVDPFVVDVTDHVTPGTTATVSYEATVADRPPADSTGNVELRSWLVIRK